MKKKKDFTKFTKRNTHKRKAKDAARRELMRAIEAVNVEASGVKLRDSMDSGYSGLDRRGSRLSATGIYVGSKAGYGFLSVEGEKRDIFIPSGNSHGAIDGDYVEAVYRKYTDYSGEEKTEGRVTRILQVGRRTVIGTLSEDLRRHGRRYFRVFYIQPDDPHLSFTPYVRDLGGARLGDRVPGSRAGVQQLQCAGLVAPPHVESSWTRNRTCVSCIGRRILNSWTIREVLVFTKCFLFSPGSCPGCT